MRLEFGYYPAEYQRTIGDISIETLPDLDQKIRAVEEDECVSRDWIYAPGRTRVFGLPKTHALSHAHPTTSEHLEFLVWCFSLFVGMPLTPTEAGFLDATPIKTGALNDTQWIGQSLEKAIECANAFWHRHSGDPRIAKTLTGAIHAFFLSQKRGLLEYEQFVWLYTALDGCNAVEHRINRPQRVAARGTTPKGKPAPLTHAERVQLLCNTFGINVPNWADPTATSNIAGIRNDTLHEGLFFGEPLGFRGFRGSTLDRHVIGSMVALVNRLLVAILELPAPDYIRSALTSRQREGVQL